MNVTINLEPLRYTLDYFINKENVEYNFNFLVDLKNTLFIELTKGVSDLSDPNASIMDGCKFSYLQGHTHFASYSKDWVCSPPSSKDYIKMVESFYRYHTKKMLIFERLGIWEIKLNDKLILYQDPDEDIQRQLQLFRDNYFDLNGYPMVNKWSELLDKIDQVAYENHIALAQPPGEVSRKITVKQYISNMKNLGFDVSFIPWSNELTFTIEIDENDFHFVNEFVANRQKYDTRKPSYLVVTKQTNKVVSAAIATREGEIVQFNKNV